MMMYYIHHVNERHVSPEPCRVHHGVSNLFLVETVVRGPQSAETAEEGKETAHE